MPKVKANDIGIAYDAFGKGHAVIYLQTAWFGRNPGAYFFAGRLSKKYRTIIWDSPNSGQSDFSLYNAPSEWHLCCEYIKGLCDTLGISSVHAVGCSGGGEMALLLAHLYPNLVKSVAMYRPTDTTSSAEREIVQARYYALAEVAKTGTMQDVINYSKNPPSSRWSGVSKWLHQLSTNPDVAKILLSYIPSDFASLMEKWGDWMGRDGFYRANLSDTQLKELSLPALIVPAADPFHPEDIAKELSAKLPNAKYVPSPFFRTESEMYGAPGEEHNFGGLIDFVTHYENFLDEITPA